VSVTKPRDWPANGDTLLATLQTRFPAVPAQDVVDTLAERRYHAGHAARALADNPDVRARLDLATATSFGSLFSLLQLTRSISVPSC
jgi:hypothetical protein